MLEGYCDLVDPRRGNHWHQHLLPEHRLCGLATSQQFTKGCKCVRWAPSVSLDAPLHLSSHLSYHPKRHCCNICWAYKAWPPSNPKQHGTRARQFLWGERVGSHSLQRGFGWYPTTRVKGFFIDQMQQQPSEGISLVVGSSKLNVTRTFFEFI